MDLKRLKDELAAIARFLEFAYLPKTASLVRGLDPNTPLGTDPNNLRCDQVEKTYREEVLYSRNFLGEQDPRHHEQLVGSVDNLITQAESKPEVFAQFLVESIEVLRAIGESHGNTRALYASFLTPKLSRKQGQLLLCLMYLIMTEGVFANIARVILCLSAICRDQGGHGATGYWELAPNDLAERLREENLSVFAEGYNRHVRNAIAHGRMKYDDTALGVAFQDYDCRRRKITFDQVVPGVELAWWYSKLDDTYLVVSTFFQLYFLPGFLMQYRGKS